MNRSFEPQLIPAQVHAHYILSMPEGEGPFPIFLTFHGLSGRAETNIPDALKIPGIENWTVIAVESPHLYYTSMDPQGHHGVGGCWVTSDNPEINIPDIAQYISTIIYNVQEDYPVDTKKVVYMGFSQGTIPAWASAAEGVFKPAGVIAVGYHMYSKLYPDMLKGRLPKALLGRGTKDPHYSEEKMNKDKETLEKYDVDVTTCVYDAGHDWHPDFFEAAGRWLAEV